MDALKNRHRIHGFLVNSVRRMFGHIILIFCHAKIETYKPKHKAFIIVGNHADGMDPGYELMALRRYMRIVVSDHLTNNKFSEFFLKKFAGVIVKHRDQPTSRVVEQIIASIKEGVPVSIYPEGAMTPNGETGFFSPRTGQMIKDSGAALITFKLTGGYMHAPKWAKKLRRGPVHGHVVREYSPNEIAAMTVEEVNQVIIRDIYHNDYALQKEKRNEYRGKRLAECVERILYLCPECHSVGKLHSSGNYLECDCGYKVELQFDGFFHNTGTGLHFESILDWDKWQKDAWKKIVLGTPPGELIYSENRQIISMFVKHRKRLINKDAELRLFTDKFEIAYDGETKITIPMDKIKLVLNVSIEALIIVTDDHYLYIQSQYPRAAAKYVAAWRFLTNKDYK